MKERDKLKKQGRVEEYKVLRNRISCLIQDSKSSTYKNKIENGKDDPKSIWKIFKEFGASNKKSDDNNILGLRIDDKIVSDNTKLAEIFNDYFINIAANLKEPIENKDLSKLKSFISSKVPDDAYLDISKGTSRQRSGKGAIRKRFPLQKPRWEKTKLTIRYLYHETYRKPNEQLFSQ